MRPSTTASVARGASEAAARPSPRRDAASPASTSRSRASARHVSTPRRLRDRRDPGGSSAPGDASPAPAPDLDPPPPPDRRRRSRRAALLDAAVLAATACSSSLLIPAGDATASTNLPSPPVSSSDASSFAELEARARAAYRAKRLDEALDLLTRIVALEPEDGQWYERRAQVLVDLKRFREAVDDFDAAVARYEPEYRSLGLLSNRALAREGLGEFDLAIADYDECVRLSREIGKVPPYVLNSRGNALGSVGEWERALEDYRASARAFQETKNLSGAIYARSNAALALAELGREDEAISEMEAVARRAVGSIDMRAALAAMRWSRGEEAEAEATWGWACEKINSGVLVEGGPALDGCALYRDPEWLGKVRRWPPSMVRKMGDFLKLRDPSRGEGANA